MHTAQPPSALPVAPTWPLWRRWLLNFGTVYLVSYFLMAGQGLLTMVPDVLTSLHSVVGVFYERLLHKSWPPLLPTGSGDTLFDWTLATLLLVIALVAGTAWTAFQRKVSSQHVPVLSGLLRFFLAYSLLSYGLIKFNFGQFGLLNDWQLTATYGESSPMGLLWRFMATSPGYQWLAGVAEVLPPCCFSTAAPSPLGRSSRLSP